MVQAHPGLAKPTFCIPRTTREALGAHSFLLVGTQVLHSQNEMRIVGCTFMLVWRNLGFAFPERSANPLVHTHSGLAKPRFCIPRTRFEPYGAHSFWIVHTHAELATPKFCNPRTRYEPYGAHSSCVGETKVLHARNESRPDSTHPFWMVET